MTRRATLLAGGLLLFAAIGRGDEPKVVPSAEARNHVGKTCTVQLTVKASKDSEKGRRYYLDSEEDYNDEKNFAVIISYDHRDAFAKAGIADPAAHYKGKTIRVTGEVLREEDQTRIHASSPEQIKVVAPAQ